VAKKSGSRIKPKIAPVVDLDIELSTDEDFEENGVPILLPQSKKTFTPTPARKRPRSESPNIEQMARFNSEKRRFVMGDGRRR
jgi:hypothetical protein